MSANGDDNVEKFKPIMNSAWLTIITMTTVGYGDLYPQTFFGRTFGVLSFIVGNVLISIIVVVLGNETNF